MAGDFYETDHGKAIQDAYERGRLDGIALAINDLDEAKEEWDEHHSKLEWQRGLAEGRYTHPRAMTTSPDDGLPF